MMFFAYGVAAVLWVISMLLVATYMINYNPDTSRMPLWKRWAVNALVFAAILYMLPLLVTLFITDLVIIGVRRL